jgi:acetyltransferase-like isoleucine patch superfamily enzyme
MAPFIHALSDVKSKKIGDKTSVWQFSVILEGAQIGHNCNICSHCFIENEVVLGNNITIKNGIYLYDGITIEDDVFIGPNATFTNDKKPRSKVYPPSYPKTLIKRGATIGAGAIILPGIIIGEHSMIGAGTIITKNVPNYAIIYGAPAKIHGYITP